MRENKLFSGAGDGMIKVWDMKTGACLASLVGHCGSVLALVATSENTLLSGSRFDTCILIIYSNLFRDHTIKLWDVESASCIRTISNHDADVLCMAINKGVLYSGSSDGVILAFSTSTYHKVQHEAGGAYQWDLHITCA